MRSITPELVKDIHQRMVDYLNAKGNSKLDYVVVFDDGIVGGLWIDSDRDHIWEYASVDDLYKSKEEIMEDEMQKRLKQEQEREELERQLQIKIEQREREQYEWLKAKFEK